jgi:hypothetical protein
MNDGKSRELAPDGLAISPPHNRPDLHSNLSKRSELPQGK